MAKQKYRYEGPVNIFGDQPLRQHWASTTYAVSEAKAISNFKYQIRQQEGLMQCTPVSLVCDVVLSK